MANMTTRLAAQHDGRESPAGDEDELRVLTALIGCIMVAEDADGRRTQRTGVHHLSPPTATRLAEAG